MRQSIENNLHIKVDGVDLNTVSKIEFYLRQGRLFFEYTPVVISEDEMLVNIPFEDAKALSSSDCRLQFAFTDANGNPLATEVETVSVGVLLKEAGYDPI